MFEHRRERAALALASALLFSGLASAPALAQPTSPTSTIMVAQAGSKPSWAELNAAQKTALAPLAGKWDSIPVDQKSKWVEIGNKFASMPAAEQARVQARMREWAALTPEERNQARENFQKSKSVPKDAKQAQWEQYQALPEEKKKELAEKAAAEKAAKNSHLVPAGKPVKP
jgi:hypothetical protein